MIKAILYVLLVFNILGDRGGLNRVRDANAFAVAAQQAFNRGQYPEAVRQYEKLRSLRTLSEQARLNLAHAYYRANQAGLARAEYAGLSTSADLLRRSVALQQLGLLAADEEDYQHAAELLQRALRANPGNGTARYDYEALARYLANQSPSARPKLHKRPPQSGTGGQSRSAPPSTDGSDEPTRQPGEQNRGGARQGQNGREQQQQQGNAPGLNAGLGPGTDPNNPNTNGGRRGSGQQAADSTAGRLQTERARLAESGLPLEKALMLLEALNAAEQQYLQQVPAPPRPAPDPTRPDW